MLNDKNKKRRTTRIWKRRSFINPSFYDRWRDDCRAWRVSDQDTTSWLALWYWRYVETAPESPMTLTAAREGQHCTKHFIPQLYLSWMSKSIKPIAIIICLQWSTVNHGMAQIAWFHCCQDPCTSSDSSSCWATSDPGRLHFLHISCFRADLFLLMRQENEVGIINLGEVESRKVKTRLII